MYAQVEKTKDTKSRSVSNAVTQKKNKRKRGFAFSDERCSFVSQKMFRPESNKFSSFKSIYSLNTRIRECNTAQLFKLPPASPPANGERNSPPTLNGHGVPISSYITTKQGVNDLVGTPPDGTIINGWPFIQAVGAAGPWVRFHMINEQIGGLGDQNNLIPTSHATNHNAQWKKFEKKCKDFVRQNIAIHASVDVTYPPQQLGAVHGTLAANQHFYPDHIVARLYRWNPLPAPGSYILDPIQPDYIPFPLQLPAVAGITCLSQQTVQWIESTLMAGILTTQQATVFRNCLADGTVTDYITNSNEPTPEMMLLDALDQVGEVNCLLDEINGSRKRRRGIQGSTLPPQSRIQVLNGAYIL